MKRFLCVLIAASMATFLVGCGSGAAVDDKEQMSATSDSEHAGTPNANTKNDARIVSERAKEERPPTVSVDDIKSGQYNNQMVYIEGAVSGVSDNGLDGVDFDVWLKNDEQYFYDPHWIIIDITEKPNLLTLREAQSGEVYGFFMRVSYDGSIGASTIESVEKTDKKVDLSELTKLFKENCVSRSCSELLRNPEDYSGSYVRLDGMVLQIISETDWMFEFLLDTGDENGIAYIQHIKTKGQSRILEGDNVTVFGRFYLLKSYKTVIGDQNIVPQMLANFMDIN